MLEDYLKILALSNYKKNPSVLTDNIVEEAYNKAMERANVMLQRENNNKMVEELKKIELIIIEAYKILGSEDSRREYFERVKTEKIESSITKYSSPKNVIEEAKKEVNNASYSEEDLKRIIIHMNNQTKTIEKDRQIQYVPIASKKNGKTGFGKVITNKKIKDDRERA